MCVGVRQLQRGGGSSAGAGEDSEGPASETRTPPAQITTAGPTWQHGPSRIRPEPGHPVHR